MVIRMRHTRAHTRNRRSHHALKEVSLAVCSNCKASVRPHHMCLACGFYNGRQVIDLSTQSARRAERIRAKKERVRAESGSKVAPTPENSHEHIKDTDPTPDKSQKAKRGGRSVTKGTSSKKEKQESS